MIPKSGEQHPEVKDRVETCSICKIFMVKKTFLIPSLVSLP